MRALTGVSLLVRSRLPPTDFSPMRTGCGPGPNIIEAGQWQPGSHLLIRRSRRPVRCCPGRVGLSVEPVGCVLAGPVVLGGVAGGVAVGGDRVLRRRVLSETRFTFGRVRL